MQWFDWGPRRPGWAIPSGPQAGVRGKDKGQKQPPRAAACWARATGSFLG